MTGLACCQLLAAASLVLTAACSGTSTTAEHAVEGGTGDLSMPGRSYAPTYDAIWNEIFLDNCLLCHSTPVDYLSLPSEAAGYRSLVGVPAQGPDCTKTALLRVEPYHPERSLLYLKITNPPCGDKMPLLPGNASLGARDVAQIGAWIACGALDGDAGCSADAGDRDGPDASVASQEAP